MPRLDKILSDAGVDTRSRLRQMIRGGRVSVGGAVARDPGTHCDYADEIRIDGEPVICEKYVYVMLNKPAGVISATEDTEKTVLDLLPEIYSRLGAAPVGRLDKDAEGLMLLTNDGALAHSLTSPKHKVPKLYEVRFEGALTGEDADAFARGIELHGGETCLPAILEPLSKNEARLTITEGKFHQVKRMFASRGMRVVYLRRVSIGPLRLDESLAPGGWRKLTRDEISSLRA